MDMKNYNGYITGIKTVLTVNKQYVIMIEEFCMFSIKNLRKTRGRCKK